MAREPRPFIWRNYFCTNAGGKPKHKLCKVEEGLPRARELLYEYLATLARQRREQPGALSSAASATVGQLHDLFLDFKKLDTELRTYQGYVMELKPLFARYAPRLLTSLTRQDGLNYRSYLKNHLPWQKGKETVHGLGNCSVNHKLQAARCLLNYAVEENLLLVNPWQNLKNLPEEGRKRLLQPEEFQALVDHSEGSWFQTFLWLLRCCPFRPSEARLLDWSWINWDSHQVTVPLPNQKTRRSRRLTLIDPGETLLRSLWLSLDKPSKGLVFPHGKDGQAVRSDSLSAKFRRLRDHCVALGLLQELAEGEKLVLYSSRHTRITELVLQPEVSLAHVQQEAGHANLKMTEHYIHLSGQETARAIRRAAGHKD